MTENKRGRPPKQRKMDRYDKDEYLAAFGCVKAMKQKLADARMANASARKDARNKGIHGDVPKVMRKLEKMSADKLRDWLCGYEHATQLQPESCPYGEDEQPLAMAYRSGFGAGLAAAE